MVVLVLSTKNLRRPDVPWHVCRDDEDRIVTIGTPKELTAEEKEQKRTYQAWEAAFQDKQAKLKALYDDNHEALEAVQDQFLDRPFTPIGGLQYVLRELVHGPSLKSTPMSILNTIQDLQEGMKNRQSIELSVPEPELKLTELRRRYPDAYTKKALGSLRKPCHDVLTYVSKNPGKTWPRPFDALMRG